MEANTLETNRTYKARLFALIFSEKEECLKLYNAVNGTDYRDPEQLEINTLEDAIYLSMHNDVSFVIDSRLSLYEHQSTKNPNLPLRFLIYSANLYAGMVRENEWNLYGEKPIPLPTPRFVIFYNGTAELPERQTLRLSDRFEIREEEPSLELTATLLNINPGYNAELKGACRTLADYAEYTARVRENLKTMATGQAVDAAIASCIRDGVMADFLKKNKAEAKNMSIFEYDEEEYTRLTLEEGREQGREEGREQGREEGWADGHSAGVKEGRAEGRISALLQTVQGLVETMNMSAEQAMDALKISEGDREAVLKQL